MKTPTTITVIAWNYCQNSCSYCVSESNKKEWNFNGSFEIWKPEGEEHLTNLELEQKYGYGYYHTMCPDKERYLNAEYILDFDYLIRWMKKYRPEAHIHLSGGEPLLRPDIEEQVTRLSKEFPVTIVTNGQLIPERPKLLDLDIKWLATYHKGQTSEDKFLKCIEPIKNKLHMITTVMTETMQKSGFKGSEGFNDFNFEYRYDRSPGKLKDFKFNPEDVNDVASRRIMLVQPNGKIIPCNKHHYGHAGHIYDMSINETMLARYNERASRCIQNNRCAAYQTAVNMAGLKER